MEAILLVGGLGTRLRPLTDNTAKPMLNVAGVPLVRHQIERARRAGVEHVVLATSYRAETFAETLGDGSGLGLRIDYAVESEPLGTGGAIRNAAELLESGPDEPVLVLNGDIIDGHDLAAQIEQHRTADADVTLYLTRVDDPRDYGSVPTEGERVVAFREKSPEPVSDQINAGCYVFRRSLLDAIPAGKVVSVERETFPELLDAGHRVLGHVSDAYWRDLGTPESYLQGCVDVVLGRVDAPARPGPPGQRLVLDNAEVYQGATVDGGSFVGSGARIGSLAVVHASVVLDDAIVGEGAQITRSVIGEWATVGAGAVLDGAMVVDGYEVPAGLSPDVGARLS